LMLSDLWAWYDGTETSRMEAIGFGRGLQSVNILRNHLEDKDRGVDFFPEGWTADDMQRYARRNLKMADSYTHALPKGPAMLFCRIPLALAHATVDALAQGREKLSRADVMAIVTPLLGIGKSSDLMTKV
ncbi:MAG: phytoene/squalene synthase family protein, partial [Cyanobacteria bacterium J06638_6]